MSGECGEYRGITGKIVEGELIGSIQRNKEIETDKMMERGEHQNYRAALEFVKTAQRFDPTDPGPRFANDLHATVAEKLGLEDYSQLRFYTAVGSILDKRHGVDGFFEIFPSSVIENQERLEDNPRGIIVTLDVTTNPNKTEYKADIIISVPPGGLDPREDREKWQQIVEKISDEIVVRMKPYLEPKKMTVA